jgi:hypothetical protein
MFSFLTAIPSMLSGLFTTVNGVTAAISNEKIAQINATTDVDRIAAGERIAALQATQAVLVAESVKSKVPAYVQLLMTLPWVLYIGKVVVWDKLLNWGSTDTLSPQEWYLCYVVYGFWFVHTTVGMFK